MSCSNIIYRTNLTFQRLIKSIEESNDKTNLNEIKIAITKDIMEKKNIVEDFENDMEMIVAKSRYEN